MMCWGGVSEQLVYAALEAGGSALLSGGPRLILEAEGSILSEDPRLKLWVQVLVPATLMERKSRPASVMLLEST